MQIIGTKWGLETDGRSVFVTDAVSARTYEFVADDLAGVRCLQAGWAGIIPNYIVAMVQRRMRALTRRLLKGRE
jgi:hypothetical protein